MTFQIEHSGQVWTSLGMGPAGSHIWPIEEMFARRKFKLSVQERIRKFYPNGIEEGSLVRGLHFKPMSWRRAKIRMKRKREPWYFRRKGNGGKWNLSFGPYSRLVS